MKNAVVIAIDANYLKPARACIRSIAETNPGTNLIVLGYQLDAKQKLWLKRIDNRVSLEVRDVSEDLSRFPSRWLSSAAYARLLIGDMCSDVERVAYVDVDLLVRKSLDPLFSVDFQGAAAAAAPDLVLIDFATRHSLKEFREKPLADFYADASDGSSTYVNTGVVGIDVKAFIDLRVKEQCFELMEADDPAAPRIFFFDQDALNIVLRDQWLILEQTWNLPPSGFFQQKMYQTPFLKGRQPPAQWTEWQQEPRITHWMGNKPWGLDYPDGPDRRLWEQYFGSEPGLELPGVNAPLRSVEP